MKNRTVLLAAACFGSLILSSSATTIWTEDFAAYAENDSVNGLATATGSGTLETASTVAVNATGGLTLTGSGRTQVAVTTTSTDAAAGYFTFDLTLATASPGDRYFLQMVDGPTRNTGANPQPHFGYTVDALDFGTAGTTVTMNLFFNSSASAISYAAPDGSTESLAAGSFDVWADTTRYSNDNTNTNSTLPSNVDSIFMQTFNGQAGNVFEFDNMAFNTLPIPEPSAVLLAAFGCCALGMKRRR